MWPDSERKLGRAPQSGADALILDLEDSVAPDAKVAARGQVAHAVRAGGFGGREVIIRVNGTHTPWGEEDLIAAIAAEKKRLRRVSQEVVRASLEAQIATLEREVKRI